MFSHLKAWNREHQRGIWKGPYSLDLFQDCAPVSGLVLDAGCGVGRYTVPLALRNYEVVGVDIALTAISKLNDEGRRRGLDLTLGAADVCRLPFKDDTFDAVVCFGVLQHLFEKERVMAVAEFRRILKPGSILILEVLGIEDMRAGGEEMEPFTYQRNSGVIYHYFDIPELVRIFSDFEILDIKEDKKEKYLGGIKHIRHMISVAATERDK